jgi:hypothetical protein
MTLAADGRMDGLPLVTGVAVEAGDRAFRVSLTVDSEFMV